MFGGLRSPPGGGCSPAVDLTIVIGVCAQARLTEGGTVRRSEKEDTSLRLRRVRVFVGQADGEPREGAARQASTCRWLKLHRRLARDYETHPHRSEAMIHLVMTDLMARRLTGENTISWRDPTSLDHIRIPG